MFSEKKYMTALNLCFIPLVIYFGVTALYKTLTARLTYSGGPAISARAGTPLADQARRPLTDYAAIEQRNLFRTPDQAGTAPPPEPDPTPLPDPDNLKDTELKLKLWGTVTGDRNKAYAVIEEAKKRKQNLYRVGDTIQEALIKQILREQVILTVKGKDEKLTMEKKEASGGLAKAGPSAPFPGSTSKPSSQRISLKRAQIDDAMNDVNALMKQAKIRPHFKDGKPDGLTLSRIKRDSIFTKLGLRSGDIITGVDGQEIQSVDDALKFYNSLKSASDVTLQVRRRGKLKDIEYSIE